MKVKRIQLSTELMIELIKKVQEDPNNGVIVGEIPFDVIIIDVIYQYNHIDIILESSEFDEIGESRSIPFLLDFPLFI